MTRNLKCLRYQDACRHAGLDLRSPGQWQREGKEARHPQSIANGPRQQPALEACGVKIVIEGRKGRAKPGHDYNIDGRRFAQITTTESAGKTLGGLARVIEGG
jgi:hypothetical protein